MQCSRLIAPAHPAISLEEVWDQLRLIPENSPSETPEDGFLSRLIEAAVSHIDGKDGWLNRALVTQKWAGVMDGFPDQRLISLPLPPLQSVQAVKYLDVAGDEQTMDASLYRVDALTTPGSILLKYGSVWPVTFPDPGAVTIEFTCGYGPPDQVPVAIKQALLLLVANWYENREPTAFAAAPLQLPFAVDALLSPHRYWGGSTDA